MGEVYRARDTRLDRTVAIKILSAEVTADEHLRRRFEREARAIAALEHPHICPLYDIGDDNGMTFLVMPHLHGETLAKVLTRGPLSIDQVVHSGAEIASALDGAHRAGVVHRDLKPANIMVTKSGVKLLDFGLARLVHDDAAAERSIPPDPTVSAITEPGTVMGTLQYMAPEQVEGKPADRRADIFALGTILSEMATGKRAFTGASQASLMAAILNAEPVSISTIQPAVPRTLDRVIKKCLAKDPDARWQDAGDHAANLQWVLDREGQSSPRQASSSSKRVWLWSLLSAAMAVAVTWMLKPAAEVGPTSRLHFTIDLPPQTQFVEGTMLALSPDGARLVYSAMADGESQLFVHDLATGESKALAGTTGGHSLFFSPDGEWIGFSTPTGLKRVSVNGCEQIAFDKLFTAGGASWGSQDLIALTATNRAPLTIASASGGSGTQSTSFEPQSGETSHRFPEFLPGGEAVVFTAGPPASGPWYEANIVAHSLKSGERSTVIRGAAQARYSPSGHLVYSRAGTLFAVPFDVKTLRVTGTAFEVLEGVREDPGQGMSQFALSGRGTLAYVSGGLLSNELVSVDRRGNATPLLQRGQRHLYYQPRVSPNGRQLAVTIAGGNDDVWVYDFEHASLDRITSGTNHLFPGWTPDGSRITFFKHPDQFVWQRSDRSTPAEVVVASPRMVPQSWSLDGRLLVFTDLGVDRGSDIWVLRLEDKQRRALVQSRFDELAPTISPDGRWLAYTSDESGRHEVYVQPFPDGGQRWQISRGGGTEPLWSKNGGELFFRQEQKLMAVAAQRPFETPVELFEAGWWATRFSSRTNYDVAPDGRFVMLRSNDATEQARIHVIVNWLLGSQ